MPDSEPLPPMPSACGVSQSGSITCTNGCSSPDSAAYPYSDSRTYRCPFSISNTFSDTSPYAYTYT